MEAGAPERRMCPTKPGTGNSPMRGIWARCGWQRAAAAAGAAAVVGATGAAAQERAESSCRCVDELGDEIERCVCVVTPELPARRPRLGVSIRLQQPERYNTQGARVYGVSPDGPAAEAGLEEGDILVRVGNQSLLEPLSPEDRGGARPRRLASRPAAARSAGGGGGEGAGRVRVPTGRDASDDGPSCSRGPGRSSGGGRGPFDFSAPAIGWLGDVARERAGRAWLRVGPALGRAAPSSVACPAGGRAEGEWRRALAVGRRCVAGLELVELNEGLAEYFEAEVGDVLVYDVEPDNSLSLRAGDVILAVDGREVRDVDHARRIIGSYEARGGVESEGAPSGPADRAAGVASLAGMAGRGRVIGCLTELFEHLGDRLDRMDPRYGPPRLPIVCGGRWDDRRVPQAEEGAKSVYRAHPTFASAPPQHPTRDRAALSPTRRT